MAYVVSELRLSDIGTDRLNAKPSQCMDESRHSHELELVEPPLFRFGLRQMLLFMALFSAVLAAVVLSRGITSLALLLAALVITAHLFSTALASRLRTRADEACAAGKLANDQRRQPNLVAANPAVPNMRRSPWHSRGSTAISWLPSLIAIGALLGGLTGAVALGVSLGNRSSLAGIAVGGISAAVLGGWFAFLGGGFYAIFRHGLRDALAGQRRDEQPPQFRN